jgi:hypothetical protein
MERDALEHLLGRTRTDARLCGLYVVAGANDTFDLDAIMVSAGTADMISSGNGWESAADEEREEHPRE